MIMDGNVEISGHSTIIKELDPNECLPEDMRIPSAGQHFYRSGFSLYNYGVTERKAIFHPILVFIVQMIYLVKFCWSMMTPVDYKSRHFHLLIGDFGYFMGFKYHLNATTFLLFLVPVVSQAISIIN